MFFFKINYVPSIFFYMYYQIHGVPIFWYDGGVQYALPGTVCMYV